jgi:RNA recognition motif-containing protein
MRVRKSKGNVFIGNLPPSFTDEQLAEIFDPFGIVLSAAVTRDPETGAKLRYGFVDIATERAAAKAITSLDGTEIDGCKLKVKPSQKPTPLVKASGVKGAHREQKPRPMARRILTSADGAAEPAQPRISQSAMAREQTEAIEPPPQRRFEVVVRPARRKTPSFQVERRSLPRRV